MKAEKRRAKACKMAAEVLGGAGPVMDGWAPVIWSLSVFFEQYMATGAKGTRKDFGPRKAKVLKLVSK